MPGPNTSAGVVRCTWAIAADSVENHTMGNGSRNRDATAIKTEGIVLGPRGSGLLKLYALSSSA